MHAYRYTHVCMHTVRTDIYIVWLSPRTPEKPNNSTSSFSLFCILFLFIMCRWQRSANVSTLSFYFYFASTSLSLKFNITCKLKIASRTTISVVFSIFLHFTLQTSKHHSGQTSSLNFSLSMTVHTQTQFLCFFFIQDSINCHKRLISV